jgi:hypothetical protein
MATAFSLPEEAQIVSLLAPAADAGGRTSGYVTLENGHKAFIVVHINQGNAATIALTPLQAQDDNGTGSKAISNACPVFYDENTGSSDTLTRTTGTSYTTGSGTNTKIVVFELDPDNVLDVNGDGFTTNPFTHVAIQTGASNAANITEATLYVTPLRYRGNPVPTTTGV